MWKKGEKKSNKKDLARLKQPAFKEPLKQETHNGIAMLISKTEMWII